MKRKLDLREPPSIARVVGAPFSHAPVPELSRVAVLREWARGALRDTKGTLIRNIEYAPVFCNTPTAPLYLKVLPGTLGTLPYDVTRKKRCLVQHTGCIDKVMITKTNNGSPHVSRPQVLC
jgi:hypothetical protein